MPDRRSGGMLTSRGKSFLMRFTADRSSSTELVRVQGSLISAIDFNDSIEFEDKTFECSSPCGWSTCGVIFTNLLRKSLLLCNLQLTRDSVSMVAFCFPGEDNIASFPAS